MIHDPQAAAWLVWLESSALAVAMRKWMWLYPGVEIVHITGIVALVGGAVLFDLRLLGLSRALPVATLSRHLLPWSRVGLGLVAASGALMFTAHATEWAENPVFRIKLVLIVLAGTNATILHSATTGARANRDIDPSALLSGRIAGGSSIVLWALVLLAGRWIGHLT